MKHLVPLEEFYRQQQLPAEAGGGTWEERVAALERMQMAMKKSGWPGPGKNVAGASATRPAAGTSASFIKRVNL